MSALKALRALERVVAIIERSDRDTAPLDHDTTVVGIRESWQAIAALSAIEAIIVSRRRPTFDDPEIPDRLEALRVRVIALGVETAGPLH